MPKTGTESVITVSHPDYTGALRLAKDLKRSANALAYVRDVMTDKKLAAQLTVYVDAIEAVRVAIPGIAKRVAQPCQLRPAIRAAAKRDKKLREALDLIGFGR